MSKYECKICKKQYTRKNSLDNHYILCEYKLKTNREKKIDSEELNDIPSYLELVKIVQELTKKCNKLEIKVEEMQKWVTNKKKKINIIEWLNKNVNTSDSYIDWINMNIQVLPEHFDYLMEHNLYQTIEYVLQYNFNKEYENYIYPIKCFSEKQAIFYISEKDECGNSLWKKAIHEDIIYLYKKIYNKMLNELTIWKKENEHKFDTNIKLCEIFNKAVIKLMSISFHQDSMFSRMRNVLFNIIKTDLQSIVEYDFEFEL
jgi:hypothetical protein